MAVSATDPADLGVTEALSLLDGGSLSSLELVEACLRRIAERDGTHSHEGDPDSINAWVRVYEEDAIAAAKRADEVPAGERPPLHGVPVGLKDVYAVAGKPLTASSRAFEDVPERDSEVWASLKAAGMILLGHLHTHEFTVGGTTDQVGNPWALDRTAGGIEWRLGGGARRPDDARRDRDGHGRLASHPLGDVRDLDDQADLRDDLVPGSDPAGAELRPRRPHGADDRRLHRAARADHPAAGSAIGGRPPGQAAGAVAAALAGRSGRRRRRRARFRARGLPLARGRARRGAGAGGGARRRRALSQHPVRRAGGLASAPRRSSRPLPPCASRVGRGGREAGHLGDRLLGGADPAPRGHLTPGSIGSPITASTP